MNIFKNRLHKIQILSPTTGRLKELAEVNDEVFSSKVMGDGFAIEPKIDEIYSPVDGTVTMIFPTKHAIGIKVKTGIEFLLHIGIDSVKLNGEGIDILVNEGDEIRAGQLIGRFDRERLIKMIPSIDIIVLFTNGNKCKLLKSGQYVKSCESDIIELI